MNVSCGNGNGKSLLGLFYEMCFFSSDINQFMRTRVTVPTRDRRKLPDKFGWQEKKVFKVHNSK